VENKAPFQVYLVFQWNVSETALHYRNVICYSRFTFGIDRSVMKDTSAEERTPSWRCLGFHFKDYPHNLYLSLYVNLMTRCLEGIKIKVSYLNSCVIGRLYVGCPCRIVFEYSSAIKRNFVINSVIVVAISNVLTTICWNYNGSSAGTSGCNGGIFLRIHNFHWSHTLHQIRKFDSDRLLTNSTYIKRNVTSGCILPSVSWVLLEIHIWHFTSHDFL
jgi:hypothetical protein